MAEKLVLNTSFHVDKSVEQEFLRWLGEDFLAGLKADGCPFEVEAVSRLLMTVEEGLASYAVRVAAPSLNLDEAVARWETYLSGERLGVMQQHLGNRMLFFTTPMEDIEL
ncbi:MAG: DUF4286 family protein [Barnesiella sp.]|nr:DUF4286 family protein [Barnesiella sp.]MBD5343703.1 DUF4286 family protein [Bacteroides sp.]